MQGQQSTQANPTIKPAPAPNKPTIRSLPLFLRPVQYTSGRGARDPGPLPPLRTLLTDQDPQLLSYVKKRALSGCELIDYGPTKRTKPKSTEHRDAEDAGDEITLDLESVGIRVESTWAEAVRARTRRQLEVAAKRLDDYVTEVRARCGMSDLVDGGAAEEKEKEAVQESASGGHLVETTNGEQLSMPFQLGELIYQELQPMMVNHNQSIPTGTRDDAEKSLTQCNNGNSDGSFTVVGNGYQDSDFLIIQFGNGDASQSLPRAEKTTTHSIGFQNEEMIQPSDTSIISSVTDQPDNAAVVDGGSSLEDSLEPSPQYYDLDAGFQQSAITYRHDDNDTDVAASIAVDQSFDASGLDDYLAQLGVQTPPPTPEERHQQQHQEQDVVPTSGRKRKREQLAHVEKNISCTLCSKKFRTRGHLKVHFVVHTVDQLANPCRCAKCGKRFCHAGALALHMRSHSSVNKKPKLDDDRGNGSHLARTDEEVYL